MSESTAAQFPAPGDPPPGGDALFGPLFGSPAVLAQTDDRAWLRAMLDVEAALARCAARLGLAPAEAAAAITAACRADAFDVADLGRRAVAAASPVVPLVTALRAALPETARPYLHLGATSQDILDSALSLVARRALVPILADLTAGADRLAELAGTHRGTLQVGRTLLQQAGPTTFGLVCAGWLVALDEARAGLIRVRDERLAVGYGGPVGTLAALGDQGPRLAALLAVELGLAEPVLPWHTHRGRVAELAAALGIAAGAAGTIGLDVTLLAQTEIGELAEGTGGASSAMPHKRNPARAVLITASAHRTPALVGTVLAGLPQEAQRAAGRWQAEWPTVTELLRLTGAAATHLAALLAGLRVDAARMRANLALTRGLVMAESVVARLAGPLGRDRAAELVGRACDRAAGSDRSLRDTLLADDEVAGALPVADLDAALDPAGRLGAANVFIDRALAFHRTATAPATIEEAR
jgi:3-carboxy-cis,cis-muconate cycloisomerase